MNFWISSPFSVTATPTNSVTMLLYQKYQLPNAADVRVLHMRVMWTKRHRGFPFLILQHI